MTVQSRLFFCPERELLREPMLPLRVTPGCDRADDVELRLDELAFDIWRDRFASGDSSGSLRISTRGTAPLDSRRSKL